jgi:hypothetical protein
LVEIFKQLGRFEPPLYHMDIYGLDSNNSEIKETLAQLSNTKPNVLINVVMDEEEKKLADQKASLLKSQPPSILLSLNSEIENASYSYGFSTESPLKK